MIVMVSGDRNHPSMPACLSILSPLAGLPEALPACLGVVSLPQALEFLSGHAVPAVLVAMAFGILFGWAARRRTPAEEAEEEAVQASHGLEELRWRHEKLVLTERQQVEKQARLDAFADAMGRLEGEERRQAALRLFVLAERVREARQKVGSDLSRMVVLRDRIGELLPVLKKGGDAAGACRGMAEVQAGRLEEAREALRSIAEFVVGLEADVLEGKNDLSDPTSLRKELVECKGRILDLPQGWSTSGEETDRRLRELLATVNEPVLMPVREILLVDGALTASLAGVSGIDLAGAAGGVVAALDKIGVETKPSPKEELAEPKSDEPLPGVMPGFVPSSYFEREIPGETSSESGVSEFGFPVPEPELTGFTDPAEFMKLPPRPSKGFHDLTLGGNGNGNGNGGHKPAVDVETGSKQELEETLEEEAVDLLAEVTGGGSDDEEADPERSLVLFCSNDVELWGQNVYRGARCRARAISEFPEWASWISIRRLDTNERVLAPIRSTSLKGGQGGDPFGFNGTNELFYGARHLGLFSESCPNEVETRFTYGGWGFGHRAHEIAPDVEQLQAAGWEGREIPADTVFEIVIHEELPALGKLDRLLESEVRGGFRTAR